MQNVNFMRLNYLMLFSLSLFLMFIFSASGTIQKCHFSGIRNLRIQSKLASRDLAKVGNLPDMFCHLLPCHSSAFLALWLWPIEMLWQFQSPFPKIT